MYAAVFFPCFGVTIFSITYLSRGIPRVTFISPLPAKWKVLRVIWVDGSPIDYNTILVTMTHTHAHTPERLKDRRILQAHIAPEETSFELVFESFPQSTHLKIDTTINVERKRISKLTCCPSWGYVPSSCLLLQGASQAQLPNSNRVWNATVLVPGRDGTSWTY